MQQRAKSYLASFFLLALLFPLAEKTLHEWSHANDKHCDSRSSVHLHQQEHHCEICDFVLDGFLDSITVGFQPTGTLVPSTIAANLPFLTIKQPHYLFPLKAPPLS